MATAGSFRSTPRTWLALLISEEQATDFLLQNLAPTKLGLAVEGAFCAVPLVETCGISHAVLGSSSSQCNSNSNRENRHQEGRCGNRKPLRSLSQSDSSENELQ